MKRFLRILPVLLAALSAACSPHEFPVSGPGDLGKDFALRIVLEDDLEDLPQITPTKSGQIASPRYTMLFWRYRDGDAFGGEPDYSVTFTRSSLADLDTTIYLPVLAAKYRMAGWVDWAGGDAGPGYDLSDPGRIMLPAEFATGERARDAFAVVADYDVDAYHRAGEGYQQTASLQRPVAQLRIVAPEALTFLALTGLEPSSMRATLRYTAPVPDGYDLLQGTTAASRPDVTLTATPRYDTSGELVFVSDFLFSTDAGTTIPVAFTLTDQSGNQVIVYSGDIPLRRGHATTVSFDLPYGGDVKPGGIGIDPGFDDEIEINLD